MALFAADHGRAFGWTVERDGRRIAELLDPVWDSESQFWYRYRIQPLSDDPAEVAALETEAFWANNAAALTYCNRKTGDICEQAVPGKLERDAQGKAWLAMRGLQAAISAPSLLERLLLWLAWLSGSKS